MENLRQRVFLTGFSSFENKTAVLFTQEVEVTPDGPILKHKTEYIRDKALADRYASDIELDRQAFADAVHQVT